jgi:hypothetical protein
LYISAHWCPPCRVFTPMLAAKYKLLKEAGEKFEILFLSCDRTKEECATYFAEMPWKLLSFDDEEMKQAVMGACEVNSIPSLLQFDKDGFRRCDLICEGSILECETIEGKHLATSIYISYALVKLIKLSLEIVAVFCTFCRSTIVVPIL